MNWPEPNQKAAEAIQNTLERLHQSWINQPISYEIHVTVKTNDVERFKEVCRKIGVKPIVISLQSQIGSEVMKDVMTSSKITGTDEDAFRHMGEVSSALRNENLNVIRTKIETVPWHPKAILHGEDSTEGYFETHIPVRITSNQELENVKSWSQYCDFHLSRNPYKINQDGSFIQMITARERGISYDEFQGKLFTLLSFSKFDLVKKHSKISGPKFEIEYALYDSNEAHDASWIHSETST